EFPSAVLWQIVLADVEAKEIASKKIGEDHRDKTHIGTIFEQFQMQESVQQSKVNTAGEAGTWLQCRE
ncbi:MAG: hypothetical protein MMC33_002578, partial [Icmadophila ericetorum]|nr:hypothetical protein [Icmadophila ericetorum]